MTSPRQGRAAPAWTKRLRTRLEVELLEERASPTNLLALPWAVLDENWLLPGGSHQTPEGDSGTSTAGISLLNLAEQESPELGAEPQPSWFSSIPEAFNFPAASDSGTPASFDIFLAAQIPDPFADPLGEEGEQPQGEAAGGLASATSANPPNEGGGAGGDAGGGGGGGGGGGEGGGAPAMGPDFSGVEENAPGSGAPAAFSPEMNNGAEGEQGLPPANIAVVPLPVILAALAA